MKARWLSMMRLGLAVACLCLAPQSPAAKGGIPGAPGGEDPPPDPEPGLPFTYQRFNTQLEPHLLGCNTYSINDSGFIAGTLTTTNHPDDNCSSSVLFVPDMNTQETADYRSDLTIVMGTNEAYSGYTSLHVNNLLQVAGVDFTWSDIAFTNDWFPEEPFTNWCHRAVFWDNDGIMTELWNPDENDLSQSCAINDSGLAVIVDCEDYDKSEDFSGDNWGKILNSYIVVPDDCDGDGVADTWYADDDGNGINDLALLVDNLGYHPLAINKYAEIVFSEGVVLIPEDQDEDGVADTWYADDNGDGINDLLIALRALEDNGTVRASDINDFGQIVGSSAADWDDRRAVIWPSIGALPIELGKPTQHANRAWATGINNAGQIIGSYYNKQDNLNYKHTAGSKPFLFHDGVIYPFRDLTTDGSGWNLQDINDTGWIINGDGAVYIPVEQP